MQHLGTHPRHFDKSKTRTVAATFAEPGSLLPQQLSASGSRGSRHQPPMELSWSPEPCAGAVSQEQSAASRRGAQKEQRGPDHNFGRITLVSPLELKHFKMNYCTKRIQRDPKGVFHCCNLGPRVQLQLS